MPSVPVSSIIFTLLNGMSLPPNISFCHSHICAGASVKSPFVPFWWTQSWKHSAARAEGATGPDCPLDLLSWVSSFLVHCWLLKSLVGLQIVVSWPWGLRFKPLLTAWLLNLWIPFSCCWSVRGAGNVLSLLNLITECSVAVALPAALILICVTWLIKAIPVPGFGPKAYFQDRLW